MLRRTVVVPSTDYCAVCSQSTLNQEVNIKHPSSASVVTGELQKANRGTEQDPFYLSEFDYL